MSVTLPDPQVHTILREPSAGGGDLANFVSERLRSILASRRDDTRRQSLALQLNTDNELRLFSASASLKMALSSVSMHLPADWRRSLYQKIDDLHVADEWEDTDKPADIASFWTFLRTVLQQGAMKRMSLGLSNDGLILAGWKRERDTLSFAFLPNDRIRWSIVRHIEGNTETGSGMTTLDRLPEVLKPYDPEVWFGNADNLPAG